MRFTTLVTLITVVSFAGFAQAGFYGNHIVVSNTFDSDFSNVAAGPASAGAAGDAGTSGPVSISAGTGVGGGGSAYFADGTNRGSQLIWDNAAAVDVVGADGATYVLDFKKGDSPDAGNAPGWLYNDNGGAGTRIQSDGASFRAKSPGGFHGGGTFTSDYHRVVQTIRPIGGGQFESAVFLSAANSTTATPAGVSGAFGEVSGVSVGRVGATPSGWEFRLSDAHVDNFMIFDIGMSDAQVAGIPTSVIPEPTTVLLLLCGVAGLLLSRRSS